MSTKELLARICDANDAGASKVALFSPAILKATRKDGLTTFTIAIKTDEFSPEDVLNGLWMALAVVGSEQIKSLEGTP